MVNRLQHWSRAADVLDHLEAVVMQRSPLKGLTVSRYCGQQAGKRADVWQKMCQVLREAKKSLDLVVVMRCLPLSYSRHLGTVGVKAMLIDHMTETLYLLSVELTLFCSKEQRVLSQFVKHQLQMLLVFFDCFAKHEDVVQVNVDEYSDVVSEYRVHQPLKG